MYRPLTSRLSTVALAAAAVVAVAVPPSAAQAAVHAAGDRGYALPAGVKEPCAAPSAGHATCAALTRAPAAGSAAATTPTGYAPADLRSAYNLPTATNLGQAQTVAVITAFDDPDAESDLGTYRSQYGIAACTTANGCFKKVNQAGGTTYPPTAAGWSAADAQSLDMISAACPSCHILLVESNSTAISDLGTAENEAAALGAAFIDNDWFTPEASLGSAETSYDSQYFAHPGAAITAPAGDAGYGVDYPAASPDVTAVGGTTLTKNASVTRGWTETAWSGTGAGCSAMSPSQPGRPTLAAPTGPPTTPARSPTPTPPLPTTTPQRQVAGPPEPAPAWPQPSSPRPTHWPGRQRPAPPPRPTCTSTPARRTRSPAAPTAPAARRTCAPQAAGTTARPGWVPRPRPKRCPLPVPGQPP